MGLMAIGSGAQSRALKALVRPTVPSVFPGDVFEGHSSRALGIPSRRCPIWSRDSQL